MTNYRKYKINNVKGKFYSGVSQVALAVEWVSASCSVVSNSLWLHALCTVHGILRARILEWVAFPSPGDLPNPGIKPRSALLVDSLAAEPQGKPKWVGKNLPDNAEDIRDEDSISQSGRYPGEGNGNPFQYSCLENSMDRGAWWATIHEITKSQTRLSD